MPDDVPAHISQVAMAAATECSWEIIPHPLYSPDLAPLDFYQFPNLKTNFCGSKFGIIEGIIDAVDGYQRTRKKASVLKG